MPAGELILLVEFGPDGIRPAGRLPNILTGDEFCRLVTMVAAAAAVAAAVLDAVDEEEEVRLCQEKSKFFFCILKIK